MTKQDTIDLNLLIATFRCFNEQLYNLKGSHAGIVKMKFNRLLKVSSQYEKEIVKWTDGSEELEQVYDELMDIIMFELSENDKYRKNKKIKWDMYYLFMGYQAPRQVMKNKTKQ